ncbi:MAG: hypothetical protein LBG07_07675 [Treponema sp.]|jgi:hypothetical protein|nr:hypothetical protein [Treponema sp.]
MYTIDHQSLWRQAAGKKGALLLALILVKMRVVMQKTEQWRDQISYYRFFNKEKV